jgi:outer membrane protein assembly factor BamB
LEAFDLKNSVWYKKNGSAPYNGSTKKIRWRVWGLFPLLLLGFITYLILRSPFTPNLLLLFYKPSSRIETKAGPEEWTTFAGTPSHRRFLDGTISFKGKVRWSLAQSAMVDSSPAVADGTLFVGDNFKVLALNVQNGRPIWTYPITGPVNSSPSVAGDLVFLGLLDGRVIALNRHSGKLQWEFKTGNFIGCSPAVVDGLLYIGSADGRIYALDAKLGTLVWKDRTNANIIQAPAVGDGIVYAASGDQKLYSWSALTGARRLEFVLPRTLIDTPVISPDTVYLATLDGRLTALKHKSRQYPWSHSVKAVWIQFWIMGFPLPTPSLQTGTLWGTFPRGKKGRFVSSPAVAGDRLFVGDDRGRFYALDARRGTPLWEFKPGEGIATSPLIIGDTVYFGTETGDLYGLNRQDGSRRWKFSLGSPLRGDLVYGSGLLFVRTARGMLYAIE